MGLVKGGYMLITNRCTTVVYNIQMYQVNRYLKHLLHSEKDPFKVPWGIKDFIFVVLLYNLVMLPLDSLFKDTNYQIIFGSLIMALVTVAILRYRFKINAGLLGIKDDDIGVILRGIPLGLILAAISMILSPNLHKIVNSIMQIPKSAAFLGIFVLLRKTIFLLLVVPFCEELMFRGFIYAALRKKLNILYSTFLCSLLFAMLHGYTIMMDMLAVFIVSIFLTLSYERNQNIFVPVIAHSVYNFISYYSSFIVAYAAKHPS